jgi:Spy/CpxP family protein refolding chaperone
LGQLPLPKQNLVTGSTAARSSVGNGAVTRSATRKQNMKRNLLTLAAVGAIALSGFAIVEAQDKGNCPAGGGWHGHGQGNPLESISQTLNLTPDQKAKVQPILDQAKPQIVAIHQDAMQKTKAIMDNTVSQIRPLLTPEQQTKLDGIQKAHQDLHNAMKELHDAKTN